MASSATVGMLRALLVADTAQFDAPIAKSTGKIEDLSKESTRAAQNLAKMLGGDALIKKATDIQQAMGLLATRGIKLTADEAARLEPTVAKAIQKLEALGKASDPSTQALRQTQVALKGVADQAGHTGSMLNSMASRVKEYALGFVTGQVAYQLFTSAGRAAFDLVKDSITEYLEAEKVQKKLTAALTAQGNAIPSVIDQYEALSKKYQRVTTNSDEAIKSSATLLVQVGNVLPHEMDKALSAVTNLSAGLGIDLTAATMMVSKAFEDNFASLGRAGVQIDKARAQAEGMEYVLGQIEARFGGQALAEAESYAGKIKQLENNWKDLQEQMGEAIVKSGAAELAMTGLQVIMAKLAHDVALVASGLKAMPDLSRLGPGFFAEWIAGTQAQRALFEALMKAGKATPKGDISLPGSPGSDAAKEHYNRTIAAYMKRLEEQDKATKKHAASLQGLEDEYQKIKREFLTGISDAFRKQIDTEIRLAKETGLVVGVFAQKSTAIQDLIKWTTKLNLLPPPPPSPFDNIVPFIGVPGPVNRTPLGDAPPLPRQTDWAGYAYGINSVIGLLGQFSTTSQGSWRVAFDGTSQAMGILSQYASAMSTATTQTQKNAAASTAAGSAATMAISLWYSYLQQQQAEERVLVDRASAIRTRLSNELNYQIPANLRHAPVGDNDAMRRYVDGLERALRDAEAVAREVSKSLDKLTEAAQRTGGKGSAALQPMIAQLLTSNRLTEQQRDLLEGMQGEPTWQYLQEQAEKYGIALESLGSRFQQNRLGSQFDDIFTAFTHLTDAGADSDAVLRGMADEVQELLNNAMRFGSRLPEFMKPMLTAMVNLGLLTDDAGNKLGDLSRFTFDASIESSFQRMADLLQEIVDLLARGLPNAGQIGVRGLNESFEKLKGPPALGGQHTMSMPSMTDASAWTGVTASQTFETGSGGTMTVQLIQDGRTTAEAIVPWLPGATKRYGVGR